MTGRPGRDRIIPAARRRGLARAWADRLRDGAGWLVGAALVFAPWCWGCAWPAGIRSLDLILLPATALWLGAALLRRESRPALLRLVVVLILVQGWAMTLNARSIFGEATRMDAPLAQALPGWPGSVERDLSGEMMARVTALLGVALIAASLGRERVWRRRWCLGLVLTAVSIVLLGCAEHWTGATDIFWSRARRLDYFFASYRNVTSAGEYLNLALPLALAGAWTARERSPGTKAWAVCALAVLVAGLSVCGSKAAPILAAGLGGAFLLLAPRPRWEWSRAVFSLGLLLSAVVVLAVGLMAWGAGLGVAQDRWSRFLAPAGDATVAGRLDADRVGLLAAEQAGLLGNGPGTFSVVFERWQDRSAAAPSGRWLAAHNDYLQTALEWGAGGAFLWSLYFFGALARLGLGIRLARWRSGDRTWALGILLSLTGTAAMALVDFPLQVASIQLPGAVLAGLGWSSFAWPQARARRSRIYLRDGDDFIPSRITRCVDRRCCEFDLSGSVDPIPETTASQEGENER